MPHRRQLDLAASLPAAGGRYRELYRTQFDQKPAGAPVDLVFQDLAGIAVVARRAGGAGTG